MVRSKSTMFVAGVAVLVAQATAASYNGLAVTPQMGWDNWNAFACDVDEELLLNTAQRMVDYGLRDLGEIAPRPLSSIETLMGIIFKAITMSFSTTVGQTAGLRTAPYKQIQPSSQTACPTSQISSIQWDWDSACTRVPANIPVHNMQPLWVWKSRMRKLSLIGALVCFATSQ